MSDKDIPNESKNIVGIYCDTQIQNKSEGGAKYFLDFLDCIYKYDSDKQTEEFYHLSKEFIKTRIPELDRIEYLEKLNSYMRISEVIVLQNFLDLFPEEGKIRQDLEELYQSKNIENIFENNSDLIKNKIKQMRFVFKDGLIFSGDSETIYQDVKITTTDNETIIKVKSGIKDY